MKKFTLLIILTFFGYFSNAQNNCATALPVNIGLNVVGVIDGAVPNPICAPNGAIPVTNRIPAGEWYTYTPTEDHTITISTDIPQNNPLVDTRFHVYTGNCSSLVCYSGDDDSGNGFSSIATFNATAGTTYYIAWDNRWLTTTQNNGFSFIFVESPFIPNPCDTATAITAGTHTVSAIDGGNRVTSCSTASMGKWFSYTPTVSNHLTITSDLAVNTCKNTNFSVYTGNCSTLLTCVASDDNAGIIECNVGSGDSFLSSKRFDVNAGVTYYIVWDNKWSDDGFDFKLIEEPIIVPVNYNVQTISTINTNYNMCIVDMNNDHLDDIVGISQGTDGNSSNIRIHYQGAGGTFTTGDFLITGTSRMPTWSLVAGDYNKDGFNDLMYGNGGGVSFVTSNGSSSSYTGMTPPDYIFCQRTNFADLNNDGNLDPFSCHDVAPNCYYLNDGNGNLTFYQSGVTPGAMSVGSVRGNYATIFSDFDNDGDSDIFVSKCSGVACEIHRNDGNGIYTDISAQAQINILPITTWSSAVADFDNDGDMDILIGSNGNVGHKFFRNDLDKTNSVEEPYANITAGSGWDTNNVTNRDYVAFDFDNDGLVDVLGGGNQIMFNKGNNFFEPTSYPAIRVGAVGDINDDGFLDIMNGTNLLYAVPNGNHWVKVALQGIQSNSNGIGARIEVYGNWGKQIRDVRSGEGFGFMNTLNTHFGLGAATQIDQIVIKWPSGIIDTINNVTANQKYMVTEGSTLSVNNPSTNLFTIYPNPVKNEISIQVNQNNPTEFLNAEIYDLNGKKVIENKLNNNKISVEGLSTGTYILLLKDNSNNLHSQKFIKE